MFEFIQALINSPAFYFCTGILLLVLFFWYLATENDKAKRLAGLFFILGLSSFSLLSLLVNGMHYGIDIRGGVELTLEVQPKMADNGTLTPPTEQDMQQACDILEQRLNSTGTSEVQILHSNNKILIQIPQQDSDPERNKEKLDAMVKMLTKMAKLELLAVYRNTDEVIYDPETQEGIAAYEVKMDAYREALARDDRHVRKPALPRIPAKFGLNDYMILPSPRTDEETGEPLINKKTGKQVVEYMVVQKPHVAHQKGIYITGKEVANASPNYVRKGYVDVVLNRAGAASMGKLTGGMQIGSDRLAVVLNSEVKCAPVVQAVLHKEFNISGLNGKGEPEDISKALSNPLTSDLKVEGRKDGSAQLGTSALEQSAIAGIIGMLGVFLFCYWYYRSAGIVAMVGLSFNALALLGLMSLFGFVLTLPGIAGILLTMGVAVDANVLIYERMREEQQLGRPFIICLRNAYEKAFSAIWDSNITSLITAVILFWIASGSIKGFAVTTTVGIITSLIGAVVVTRVLFFWTEHFKFFDNLKFGKAPFQGKKYDFMKQRKLAGLISVGCIVLFALYSFFVRGEDSLGIDFTGGTTSTYVVPNDSQLDYKAVEDYVANMKLSKEPTVQEFSNATDHNIKIRCATKDEAQRIDTELRAKFPAMKEIQSPSIEEVSAALGSTFFKTAIIALLAGLAGITVYLAIRFEWSFAMGAMISTAHDVAAIIFLVILCGSELSIIHIGAFLTVAGYSINDTIVIYDRIREQLRLADPKDKLEDIMNEAINSTLSRTLLTSGSTIAVLIALIALGGPAMFDFSITMLLGIIVGTYSSIYIASPVVLWFDRRNDLRSELQAADNATGTEV